MSKEPSKQAGTPKAAKSKKKGPAKPKYIATRLFQPEYEVPFHLSIFNPARGKKGLPPRWLEAAVRSGLAVMASPREDCLGNGLLSPLPGHPPARMSAVDLQAMLIAGTADALERIKKKDDQK